MMSAWNWVKLAGREPEKALLQISTSLGIADWYMLLLKEKSVPQSVRLLTATSRVTRRFIVGSDPVRKLRRKFSTSNESGKVEMLPFMLLKDRSK